MKNKKENKIEKIICTQNNENVKNFIINNYIGSDVDPYFGILIKGKWGCGKTYIIDSVLKEKFGENYRKDDVIFPLEKCTNTLNIPLEKCE